MSLSSVLRPGIRRRLFGLSLALTVPLALVAAVRAVDRYGFEQRQLRERSRTAVAHNAQLLDGDLNRARTLITAVSPMLDARTPPAQLDSLLRAVFADATDDISNVWVSDTTGRVLGSLLPVPTGPSAPATSPSLGGREYFKAARASGTFTIGQPVRSLITAGAPWVIPVVQPLRHPVTHALRGFIGMGLRLDRLAAMRYMQNLPENSVLTVLRDDGRVFVRNRDLDRWIDRNFAADPRFEADNHRGDSLQSVRSLDGTERMVTLARLTTLRATAYVGIPASASRAAVQSQFVLDLIIALIAVLVFAGIALLAARYIANPLVALSEVATALAGGDRDRRALAYGNDEVADLARALNGMADAVQDRERALAASEVRYRSLFETSPLPTLTWRLRDGRIEQGNQAARAFFGDARLDREGGLRILELIAEPSRAAFGQVPLPTGPETMHVGRWQLRDAVGALRDAELFVSHIQQGDETSVVGVFLDITEQQRAESALEQSREALRQSQKMEALGAFAGGIAHDFNNYLSAIATNAEMLRDELPDGTTSRREADEILGVAQRAAALTRQILVFSRRQVVHEDRIDVNAVLRDVGTLLTRLVGEHIRVDLELREDAPPVLFDRGRLEQVLMNLAANARDAMVQGGTLTVRTEPTPDGALRLRVHDSGVGIPRDVLPRVFDPFYTTKPRDKGTGLGLAMVYTIVTGAGGTIEIDSTVGAGTEVVLTLPAAPAASATPVSEPVEPSRLGGTEHVLLVEDEPAVRAATATLLRRAGYRVTQAGDATQALERLAELDRTPDLLLSDVVMPGVSGPALAADLQERLPGLRVLFMSGYADDDAVMQGIASHSLHFIAKPFRAAELLAAVREALDALLLEERHEFAGRVELEQA
ncbi:MAG: response regulator [Gemmatimonadetes bacterium]|nr:response regulator [Gemmatimonadota bacterium]